MTPNTQPENIPNPDTNPAANSSTNPVTNLHAKDDLKSSSNITKFEILDSVRSESDLKKVLVASHNPSKVKRYQEQLTNLGIELISLKDLGIVIEPPKEDQKTTEEIAKSKAKYYFQKTGVPCFSCDNGLYFEGVLDSEQPGTSVKGIAGAEDSMNSEQIYDLMITFYKNLANKYGGSLSGYFLDSYAMHDGKNFFVRNVKRRITLTNLVHKKDVHFPICSLYKVGDKYYHDLTVFEMKEFLSQSMDGLRQVITEWKNLQ